MRRKPLIPSDISQRIARGAFWTFTGTALGKCLVLIAGIICANILGQQLFGELGIIRSTINMFIVFGTAGIGATATHYLACYRVVDKSHAASICLLSNRFALYLGMIFLVIMWINAPWIAENVLEAPHLRTPLLMGGVMLFISILNGALHGILTGFEDFRSIAINTFIGSLFESFLMIAGAYYYRLEGAVLGFGIGVIVLYVSNFLAVRKNLHRHNIQYAGSHISKQDWKLILSYGLPAALSALTVTPVFWIIRTLLVRYNGYHELAIFEAADQWKVIIMFIPGAISQMVLPILSSINNKSVFHDTMISNLILVAVISSALAILLILAAPLVVPLYGDEYTQLTPLILLSVSVVFACISNVIEMSIYSIGNMWTCFYCNVIWGGLTCLFCLVFLQQQLGASALALAVLLAYIAKTIYTGIYIRLILKKR